MRLLSVVVLFAIAPHCAAAELPRSTPEAQGISSAAILDFLEAADKSIDSLHGFVMVRHGHVIAEAYWTPYDARTPHALYSLSKSFTSTAIGLAIAGGKLSLDDPVLKFFPDDAPAEPSTNLKAMRVRDLLRMSTGQQTEPPRPADKSWAKAFLAHPVPFYPGGHFHYNTSATYMLSAIVQKVTGETTLDYLKPRLFGPLGIDNPTWEKSPQGISTGGYGLSIRTGDIARFGQLYLQRGRWEGKQLVPEAWVAEATTRQTGTGSNPKSDWDQGYGYQFWRSRHGAYRGDGAFGQYCIVLPEQDAVIAVTAGVRDLPGELNLVWDKLLPAMKAAPLPADAAAMAKLEDAAKKLAIRLPEVKDSQARGAGRKFEFPANAAKLESISLEGDGKGGEEAIIATFDGVRRRIRCGNAVWRTGEEAWGPFPKQPLAAGGAWTGDGTFAAKICFCETPFIVSLSLKFTGDEVRLKSGMNVGFGSTKEVELVGKAKE